MKPLRKLSLFLLSLCLTAAALITGAAAAGGPRLVSSSQPAVSQSVGFTGLPQDAQSLQATFTLSANTSCHFTADAALAALPGVYTTCKQDGADVTVYVTAKSGVLTRDGALTLGALSADDGATSFTVTRASGLKVLDSANAEYTYPTVEGGGSSDSGGTSGGGGSAPADYAVTIQQSAGGSISASHASAASGSTVTLTVQAGQGYVLDSLTVTGKSGGAVKLTDLGGGKYTFTMPASAVTVAASFLETPVANPLPFTDVDQDQWFHSAVEYVYSNKLMDGTAANTFSPLMATNRAMVVTILWRLEGSPVVNYAMNFGDVADGTWYTEAVRWAASENIVKGYSDTAFAPGDTVTREQLATILYRYLQRTGGGFQGDWAFPLDYADAHQVSGWAGEAMAWCTMKGLINGVGGNLLNPQGSATRAEVAQILLNLSTAELS